MSADDEPVDDVADHEPVAEVDEVDDVADDDMARSVDAESAKQVKLEDSVSSDGSGDLPVDPTDAPNLAGSALTRLSRFGLLGSVVQILGAIGVVVLTVMSPDRVSVVLGRAVGIALAAIAVAAAVAEVRSRDRQVGVFALAAGASIIGVLLIIDPDRWLRPIGWGIGVVLVVFGLASAVRGGGPATAHSALQLQQGTALVVGGVIIYLYFEHLFEVIAVIVALLSVASGVIGVGVRSGFTTVAPDPGRRRPMLLRWVDSKGKSSQRREDIYDAVFFEGKEAPARIGRFLLMMVFASVISAAGVLSDSTAVVIGAMLVAPLINPMMGIGLSLATGWPNRLGRSTFVVLGGTIVAIGTAWLLAIAADVAVDVDTNTQIVSRSSPGMIDLVIAVAAGSAGAYALSRKDASSSLPGVAVAIALVPPLSVVGITAHAGDWQQASGTLLLFLTNLVAIIIAGGAVFVLTGVVPLRRFAENQHRVRTAFGAVVALAVIVVGALVINGRQIAQDAIDQEDARNVVSTWLGDASSFEVVSVAVDDGKVSVLLAGPGEPPSAQRLADDLGESLGAGVRLDLQWVPRQRTLATSSG